MIITRLRPFTVSIVSGLARVFQMGVTVALVPLLVHYLDPEQFAIWLAATSLMAAATFVDLGMGSCLVNQIASDESSHARCQIKQSVSTAFFSLACVGSCVASLLLLLNQYIPWINLLSASSDTSRQLAGPVLLSALLSLCALAPLSIVVKLRLGIHEYHIHLLWEGVTYLLAFIAVTAGVLNGVSLTVLVCSFCFVPIFTLSLNYTLLIRKHGKWLAPSYRIWDILTLRQLLLCGKAFFLNNLINTVCFAFDSFIALHLLSAHEAAEFGLGQRLALSMQTVIGMMLVPYWPIYQNALSSGNLLAGRQAVQQAVTLAIALALPAATLILIAGDFLLSAWTRGAMVMSQDVSIALSVWVPIFALGAALNSFMNGPSAIKLQLRISVIAGLGALTAKVIFGWWYGAAGIIWGNVAGYGLFALVPLGVIVWCRTHLEDV